ncbi:MAG: glycosyltransferase family 39 protein [Candidatus Moranbacteria bacterium]|nr:glycosyltransferase family 39 protein [Candidatus Moranbacteria bacterium]
MIKNKYKLSAILICLAFFSLALFSSAGFHWNDLKYSGNGIIADEIPHIASGYYYLKTHRYFLNPEHPPLVKDVAGLGESIARPSFPDITDVSEEPEGFQRYGYPFAGTDFPSFLERKNTQAYFGQMYLFDARNNPDRIAFFGRLTVIFVNTLLLFGLYYIVSKLWNPRAALLGLFFIATSQFSIAHGSFVVIDFMSGLLAIIATAGFALFWKKYAEKKANVWYFFLASFLLALAEVSKFSSVILPPALFVGGLIFVLTVRRTWKDFFKYIGIYAAMMVVMFFLITLFYIPHVIGMGNAEMVQQLWDNFPYDSLPQSLMAYLAPMVSMNIFTKALVEYINGVLMVMGRMSGSFQLTYFMGHLYHSEGAGAWYFPVLYFTKLSLGFLFFNLAALFFLARKSFKDRGGISPRFKKFAANPFGMFLFLFAYFYMVITLSSTFQIGLRHIMPVIIGAAVLTGRGVDLFWEQKIWRKIRLKHAFMAVGAMMLVSLFASFPYYLSHYNLLAGGTWSGYKVATDSNYDWGGSDVRRLADWMRDNNVREIYTDFFADVELPYYLGEGQHNFNIEDGWMPPSGSYIAVSNYKYMNNTSSFWLPAEKKYSILMKNLAARVGPTIFVFKVP